MQKKCDLYEDALCQPVICLASSTAAITAMDANKTTRGSIVYEHQRNHERNSRINDLVTKARGCAIRKLKLAVTDPDSPDIP